MEDTNNRPIPGSTTTPPSFDLSDVDPSNSIIDAIKTFFSRHPEPEPNINPDEYDAYRETTIGKK